MTSFIKANLISLNKIEVIILNNNIKPNFNDFRLFINDKLANNYKLGKPILKDGFCYVELTLNEEYQFGKEYIIEIPSFERCYVSTYHATEFPEFDKLFNIDIELGAIYSKENTIFRLWSPLSTEVTLQIEEDNNFNYYQMIRIEKGVYESNIKGDLLNKKYCYIIKNSGNTVKTLDPYGKGVSVNSEYSAVVDVVSLESLNKVKPEYNFKKYTECSIYELNVRDFTEDKNTNILNKGKYLGLIEKNKVTTRNNPAGLEYLKYLGVSHIQLNPITDFYGVDDINTKKSYNWGYDVLSFFALEGSYSNNPNDPSARLYEFRQMVDSLHKNNIRVVIDVVYNHIYDYQNSCLEKSVPNYYFRKNKNNELLNASGCGNDIASEKYMVRKMIHDSVKYFINAFDIDGFRFDLMGLLDINTINKAYEISKSLKEDIIIYGEGWDMNSLTPANRASYKNASKMPNIAFFNDAYRDFIKGASFKDDLGVKGYICGNTSYVNGVDFSIHGSVLPLSYEPRFISASQSINFLECHDNFTIFDKLLISNEDEDENDLLERCRFATALLLTSFGVPFIHMGQEIGLSKHGNGNTYNKVKINNMDWKIVDSRYEMVRYFHHVLKLRKNKLKYLSEDNPQNIKDIFEIEHWNNGVYCLKSKSSSSINTYNKLILLYNPTLSNQTYELDDYYKYLSSRNESDKIDELYIKNGIISPCSLQILFK